MLPILMLFIGPIDCWLCGKAAYLIGTYIQCIFLSILHDSHRLEADTLRTVGEYTFRGLLKKGDTLSAHPRLDSNTGHLITFSAKLVGKETVLNVFEFDSSLDVVASRSINIPGFSFFHDFIVTKNYYIFNQAPTSLDPLPFLLGFKGPAECITFKDGAPSIIYLVPRDGSPVQTVEVDTHFNFHFANAFDDSDGNVIFDVVRSDTMVLGKTSGEKEPIWNTVDFSTSVPFTKLVRYKLSRSPTAGWTSEKSTLTKFNVDFTSVNPRISCRKVCLDCLMVSRCQHFNICI